MVEISNCTEPCFAKWAGGCAVLRTGKCRCKFYKPKGCEDWIRSERGNEIWLIPPEEYFAEPAVKK